MEGLIIIAGIWAAMTVFAAAAALTMTLSPRKEKRREGVMEMTIQDCIEASENGDLVLINDGEVRIFGK